MRTYRPSRPCSQTRMTVFQYHTLANPDYALSKLSEKKKALTHHTHPTFTSEKLSVPDCMYDSRKNPQASDLNVHLDWKVLPTTDSANNWLRQPSILVHVSLLVARGSFDNSLQFTSFPSLLMSKHGDHCVCISINVSPVHYTQLPLAVPPTRKKKSQ